VAAEVEYAYIYAPYTGWGPPLVEPAPPPKVSLSISIQGEGSVTPAPGLYDYPQGQSVVLSATPAPGWQFAGWILDGAIVSTALSYTVLMDEPHSITALFEPVIPAPAPVTVEMPVIEEVEEVTVPTTGNPIIDPIIQALWPIVQGFFEMLKWFGGLFIKPVEDALLAVADTIEAAVTPGTPEQKVQLRAKRLANFYRRLLEKSGRKVVGESPAIELAPTVAAELLSALIGTEVSVEISSTAADAAHPSRRLGIPDAARSLMSMLGVTTIASAIAIMPARIGVLTPLEYWYNKQFTPRIPSPSDLITMLVKEVITPAEFEEYISWHGESAEWASRRWKAHWRTVPPGMLHDAYHRGVISEEQWDKMIIFNDYNPEPWYPEWTSDLDLVRGLRKTLIPRVDLRRAWEMGVINDEELVKRYQLLGYEEDSELMAEIQKHVALAAERSAIARAAGRIYRETLEAIQKQLQEGEVTQEEANKIRYAAEQEFRNEMTDLKIPEMLQDLWVRRYQLEARVKTRPWEIIEEALA